MSDLELVTVASGARSLRSRSHGETFHPVVGPQAEAESLHVGQQRLVERIAEMPPCRATAPVAMTGEALALQSPNEFVIWDVGLGAAANAVTALAALRGIPAGKSVAMHSFDFDTKPLQFALEHREELGYFAEFANAAEQLVRDGHAQIGAVRWQMHSGDFRETMGDAPAPHAVFYDPYSPSSNPALWSLEHFTKMHARLDPERPCLLTSYSRSTAVRVTLLLAGFVVGKGSGVGEKEETTLFANDPRLIAQPLDEVWIGRVRRSTKGAPLRDAGGEGLPISDEDFAVLKACAQFRQ